MSGMKKSLKESDRLVSLAFLVSTVLLLGFVAGCDGGGNSDGNGNPGDTADDQDDRLRIYATVVDDQGFALTGATVSFVTDDGGAYLITDDRGETEYRSAIRQDLTVGASAAGHLSQTRPLSVPGDASRMRLEFVLKALPVADTQADAESGFNYTSADGTGVEISAGTLSVVRGAPVVGDISLQLSSLQFDDPLSRQAFPGAFEGQDDQFESTRLAALAAGSFRFSQADDALELTFGQTATVILPLSVTQNSNGQALAVGQTVPLWSLDESTGLWEQEGDGMVIDWDESPTGLAVQGSVSHFSWWLAAEPVTSVTATVRMDCPESDTTCRSIPGGQVDFESADDHGPWYAQQVFLPELGTGAAMATDLPELALKTYGFDAFSGYAGTNPEAIGGSGGTYPPQIPLNPQADAAISIELQPLHEVLPDWPEARGRSPLIGLLDSLNETHDYELALRPNDELLLQVTRIGRLDYDPDVPGAGAGVDVRLYDPNGIVLFNETLDSGGPLVTTVPVDTGGDHRLSLVGISNDQGGYAASTAIQRGPEPIIAQCEPYDPEPDSTSDGGQWSAQEEARESSYTIPASQRGGGIVSATLTAGHPDIQPRLIACADNACSGGSIAGDTGSVETPTAQIKFEAEVGIDYTFHIEQFGNAPADEYPQSYSLNVDFSPRVDCWEPNNTVAQAKGIRLDEAVQAYMLAGFETNSITSSEYVDWYAIDLRHAGTVQAAFNPPAGNHLMRVRLEDVQGNPVTMANQQSTAGTPFTVESNSVVNPGLYYLRVGVLLGDDRKVEGGDDPSPLHWSQQYSMTVTRQ